jgi:hypothetical protein
MLFVKRFSVYVNYQNGSKRSIGKPHVIRETLQCLRKLQNGRKRSSVKPYVIRETLQWLRKLSERQETE